MTVRKPTPIQDESLKKLQAANRRSFGGDLKRYQMLCNAVPKREDYKSETSYFRALTFWTNLKKYMRADLKDQIAGMGDEADALPLKRQYKTKLSHELDQKLEAMRNENQEDGQE